MGEKPEQGRRNAATLEDSQATLPARHETDRLGIDETQPAEVVEPVPGDVEVGARIGRFVVVEHVGRGGMGVVVAAYDPDLDRKVAIKLLRPQASASEPGSRGRDRMIREARAMARLSHPNVLTVHEVGISGNSAFIAMEYASGGNLTEWLEDEPRSWRDILDRFIAAGKGLAAAHEIGLVHRDFKPDNVLLTSDGGVRVADFGLVGVGSKEATPEAPRLDALSLGLTLTRTGALLGTPAYMAPEQHAGKPAGEAADQFAFCVALYEALYHKRPFSGDSYDELAQSVREGKLLPPAADSNVPAWLASVVTRGLASDPSERHASMNALLAALERNLVAGGRRKLSWAAAAALVLGLGVLGVGALYLARAQEPRLCRGAAGELGAVWNEEVRARVKRQLVATGRPYATDTFERLAGRVDSYGGEWTAMRTEACEATHVQGKQSAEALDLRMHCLDRRLRDLSALLDLLAGEPDAEVLDRAVQAAAGLEPIATCADVEALSAVVPPPSDPHVRERLEALRARVAEAAARFQAGKQKDAQALVEPLVGEARELGYAPLLAEVLFLQGELQAAARRLELAETAYHEALEAAGEAKDDARIALIYSRLIRLIGYLRSKPDEALALQPLARAALARAAADDRLRSAFLDSMADVFYRKGDYATSRDYYLRALTMREKALGSEHPSLATTLTGLANAYAALGKYDEARETSERSLAVRRAALGPDHPKIAASLNNLGVVLFNQGEFAAAQQSYELAAAIVEKSLGPDHADLANMLTNLGLVLAEQGKADEARAIYERAAAIHEAANGPDHPNLASALANLGLLLSDQGKLDEARAYFERALAIDQKALGPNHPKVAITLHDMGMVFDRAGQLDKAREHYTRAAEIFEKELGSDHRYLASALTSLAGILAQQDDCDGARKKYERALSIFERALGPDHPELAHPLTGLGECHLAGGRFRQASEALDRAVRLREDTPGDPVELAESRFLLARALWSAGKDRKRALRLAEQARKVLAGGGEHLRKSVAEVDAWLGAHRGK